MLWVSADVRVFVFKALWSTVVVPAATNMMFTLRNTSLAVFALLISQVAAVPNPQTTGDAVKVFYCEFDPFIHSLFFSKGLRKVAT